MKDYEDIIISDPVDCKREVQFWEDELTTYEDSIKIDNFGEYYYVYRFETKNGKPRRHNMFTLQCDTEGFADHVKYIIRGTIYFDCGKFAGKLLSKTLTIYDIQQAAKAKKIREAKAAVSDNLVQNEIVR